MWGIFRKPACLIAAVLQRTGCDMSLHQEAPGGFRERRTFGISIAEAGRCSGASWQPVCYTTWN